MGAYSILSAVNRMLNSIGHQSRDTTGSSRGSWPTVTYGVEEAGDAERLLDEATFEYLKDSNGFNVLLNQSSAVTPSPATISVPSNTLAIRPQWISRNLQIGIQGTLLTLDGSTTFPVGTYYYDVVKNVKFEDVPTKEQGEILARACELYRAMKDQDRQVLSGILTRNVAEEAATPKDFGPGPIAAVAGSRNQRPMIGMNVGGQR